MVTLGSILVTRGATWTPEGVWGSDVVFLSVLGGLGVPRGVTLGNFGVMLVTLGPISFGDPGRPLDARGDP